MLSEARQMTCCYSAMKPGTQSHQVLITMSLQFFSVTHRSNNALQASSMVNYIPVCYTALRCTAHITQYCLACLNQLRFLVARLACFVGASCTALLMTCVLTLNSTGVKSIITLNLQVSKVSGSNKAPTKRMSNPKVLALHWGSFQTKCPGCLATIARVRFISPSASAKHSSCPDAQRAWCCCCCYQDQSRATFTPDPATLARLSPRLHAALPLQLSDGKKAEFTGEIKSPPWLPWYRCCLQKHLLFSSNVLAPWSHELYLGMLTVLG